MGLSNDPACRKCGTEEETSVHILCECEALASLRHKYLGSLFLDPEDIRVLGVGAIWNFINSLSAELNLICHLLALLGGATIVVVSRLRVKGTGLL